MRVTGMSVTDSVDHLVLRAISPTDVHPTTFESFYAKERRAIVGLAYALSGSHLTAEDVAQDAFLAAYRRWDHISSFDNPGAWVRRVVANRSVSHFRRGVAEGRALLRLGKPATVGMLEIPDSSKAVWAAVRRLPRRQAQCVALHYLDNLSMPEIGSVLGCSKETVNTHIRRARKTLAERLSLEERP